MENDKNPYPVEVDLSNCENEPIHIIPHVQQHACLIACELDSFQILHASSNLYAKIGHLHKEVIGKHLNVCLDKDTFQIINTAIKEDKDLKTIIPIRTGFEVDAAYLSYNLIVHIHNNRLLLEFEPYDAAVSDLNYQYQLSLSIQKIQQVLDTSQLYQTAADEVQKISGFDRVMVYQFDNQGNGEVIAETKQAELESFLGLHYPASDIPKQARVLFFKNKVRLVSDIFGTPAEIYPTLGELDQQPLDLTYAVARGVSPVHLEYLTNMGVRATLSIAIVHNQKLWGLFACHHYSPRYISYEIRNICALIGQIFSGHLSLQSINDYRQEVLKVNLVKSKLFDQMGKDWNVKKGLLEQDPNIMDLVTCGGASLISDNSITSLGRTPNEKQITALVQWLNENNQTSHFQTNQLPSLYPEAKEYKDIGAGILALKIIPEVNYYIIWFKPEVIQTVNWGGNPEKATTLSDDGIRMSPRKSFQKWEQIVENTSLPWAAHEIEITQSLRNDIKDFILKKYKELESVNQELEKAYQELESFSYSVSHDLRAPLRSINGFAHILLEDYKGQLDEYGNSVVNTIVSSTEQMNSLIDDILAFSKVGFTALRITALDFENQIQFVIKELLPPNHPRKQAIEIIIAPNLPTIYADSSLFKQLLVNLISNAIKYSASSNPSRIEIGGHQNGEMTHFFVKDNGIGFNLKYKNEIFKVFTRLVKDDKYSGNGVGLAIVNRIVENHSGKITVKSEEGIGTTFSIQLPIPKQTK